MAEMRTAEFTKSFTFERDAPTNQLCSADLMLMA